MTKKMSIDFDQKQKFMIITIVVLILTFIVCIKIIGANSSKANSLKTQIVEASEKLALRKDMEKLNSIKTQYIKNLYSTTDSSKLRNIISSTARQSAVNVVSLKPMPRGSLGKFSMVSFEAKVRATYNNLGSFIAGLESLPEITSVTKASIQATTYMKNYGFNEDIENPNKETEAEASLIIVGYSAK